jgi:hypothetical protein
VILFTNREEGQARRPLTRFGIYRIVHRLITMIELKEVLRLWRARACRNTWPSSTGGGGTAAAGFRGRSRAVEEARSRQLAIAPAARNTREWIWTYFGDVF